MDLPEEARDLVRTSMANYQRHARVLLRIDTVNDRVVWCTVHQYEAPVNGKVLTEAELLERGTAAFGPLREAGYEPIICVYELDRGTPEKPLNKYRMGGGLEVGGKRCVVVRQKPPRMAFTLVGEELRVLVMEKHDPEANLERFELAARAFRKRDHYRR